ncbi:aldose 1-epimerase family protein [Pararhizobium sp. YC-54]|uniref:aldose 1-epimerase family protein n=1 Tax=Pararhizobium sp. YC-54 TaxID=2986920 RepID=UPI0021F78522|nr:aldose 1-epimerase family protein [Pararhizobium sp. YC-54]MCV9999868.1 aldose 1-epimerase family protein [Pararhizobium sp. YC-54]
MPASVRIENEHLTVDISSLGAEMQAITSRDGRAWLWSGDATFWSGRSPILFPIVGKAPGDTVSIDGKTYPMAQHGFARRSEFSLAASTPAMCRYELAASEATRPVYPFEFSLAVEHRLDGHTLTVAAEVGNRDVKAMPFGIGFHPAFVWPLPGAAGQPHAVTLDNGAEPPLVRVQAGLLDSAVLPSPFQGGRLELDPAMFDADAMIFPEGAGTGLAYGAKGGPSLRFQFDNLPNLALWTKPGAPFLCIEPWHGMAARTGGSNALDERPYTVTLEPGATARFAFSVEIPSGE